MKRLKFIASANGSRIVRLRDIREVYLKCYDSNGFVAAKIVAVMRNNSYPVTLAAYTEIAGSEDALNMLSRAGRNMDRLRFILNGGRLKKGESWKEEEKGE